MQEFDRFRDFLKTSFPRVHARLSREIINGQSCFSLGRSKHQAKDRCC